VWLAGGVVRDLVERQPANDVDVMVTGMSFAATGRLLRRLPDARLGMTRVLAAGRAFRVYKVRVTWAPREIDVTPARGAGRAGRPAGTRRADHEALARADAGRRDFTIDALMIRLRLQGRALRGEIVDFTGGLADLKRRLVRGVGDPSARFAEDPLRVLRAIRMAAERPGFRIERRTWAALCRAANSLPGGVAPDRIAAELIRALSADPFSALSALRRSGLLARLLPEWQPLSRNSLARAARRIALLQRRFGRSLSAPLLFAALLADLALREPGRQPRQQRAGGPHSPPRTGRKSPGDKRAPLPPGEPAIPDPCLNDVAAAARRLRLPGVRRLVRLLADLRRLRGIAASFCPHAEAQAIVARWRGARELLALYEAVQDTAGRAGGDIRAMLRRAARRPPLLSGGDLLEAGVPRGPAVGRLLAIVREATIAGQVRRREEALELVRSALASGRGGPGRLSSWGRQPSRGSRGMPSRSSVRRV